MQQFRPLAKIAILLCLAVTGHAALAAPTPPRRVVSMNVCTDQLAMMIASPGQLVSVSYLARDPEISVLADRARAIAVNYGQAEEIFLLQPDLIIAGTYSTRATVALLRQLGFPVVEFSPATSLADIRSNVMRMGELLDREDRADALIAEFDTRLAEIANGNDVKRPVIAPYYANSRTSGAGTLVDEIILAAGLQNLGQNLGLVGTTRIPLETLLTAQPDLLMFGRYQTEWASQAHEMFRHPALRDLVNRSTPTIVPDKYLICGTPETVRGIEFLAQSRAEFLQDSNQ
jgi:iron complex transport system substrate-binding protein